MGAHGHKILPMSQSCAQEGVSGRKAGIDMVVGGPPVVSVGFAEVGNFKGVLRLELA